MPLVLLLTATTVPAAPHLRGASVRETAVIRDLLARSETARALAADLEARDAIVYVVMKRILPGRRAVTQFVTASHGVRYIRITLGPVAHRDDLAALLAHELQHANEIASAPAVIDSAGVRRLYRAIGEERPATSSFETAAAQTVGARVRAELSQVKMAGQRQPGE